jgi:hypothetical protein
MASVSPEIPIETGSFTDYKVWDVNMMAEPIMRIWQLSEALSRMARRIQKRYPDEARILRTASEDVIYSFFKDMKERQDEFVKNSKSAEISSAKELDAAHQKREQQLHAAMAVGVEEEPVQKPRSRRSSNV